MLVRDEGGLHIFMLTPAKRYSKYTCTAVFFSEEGDKATTTVRTVQIVYAAGSDEAEDETAQNLHQTTAYRIHPSSLTSVPHRFLPFVWWVCDVDVGTGSSGWFVYKRRFGYTEASFAKELTVRTRQERICAVCCIAKPLRQVKMKQFVVFASVCCVLLAGRVVLSAPAPQQAGGAGTPNDVQTVKYYSENNGLDGYRFNYELSDGQIRSEVGTYRDVKDAEGKDVKALFVQGSYSFVGPDGQTYWVNYTADENGYHPKVGTGPTGGIQPGQESPVTSA
uniref:Uncharacterized protein n=1 Tax=Anopheles culicifacies TaxID=139723 RepID=A0A182M7M9_9DIPT